MEEPMSLGLANLKHIVVLMMGGRSFDHMLGALSLPTNRGVKKHPKVNGLSGEESNPDTHGAIVKVQAKARFHSQLDPIPDEHFPGVDLQIFSGAPPTPDRIGNMQGFVKEYFAQSRNVPRSHAVMYYFLSSQLPVLTALASEYAVFNGWFSSVPGPALCNRAFAHYGTSFGQVGENAFYVLDPIPSIYERMISAGRTAKIYYYDQQSSTMEVVNLLKNMPIVFGTHDQFIGDCAGNTLPDYSFVEPCYSDHPGSYGGQVRASDQHVAHDVREGELFIANTYNAIRSNPILWKETVMLVVYANHGGIYDHVVPPACTPGGYIAPADATGTGSPFAFDRLGVRVPAVLISPFIPRGTVVSGPEFPRGRTFEHASIPATVTSFFLGGDVIRTDREKKANTFLDVLSGPLRPDSDTPLFQRGGS